MELAAHMGLSTQKVAELLLTWLARNNVTPPHATYIKCIEYICECEDMTAVAQLPPPQEGGRGIHQ